MKVVMTLGNHRPDPSFQKEKLAASSTLYLRRPHLGIVLARIGRYTGRNDIHFGYCNRFPVVEPGNALAFRHCHADLNVSMFGPSIKTLMFDQIRLCIPDRHVFPAG